jgi:arsenate reductase-like glutaredoxin family protein
MVATRGKYFKESGLDLERDPEDKIIAALEAEPRRLKRPLLFDGSKALAGFDQGQYRELFA